MKVVLNFTKFHEISFQVVIFRTFSFILRQALIFRKYLILRKKYTSAILHTRTAPGLLVLSPGSALQVRLRRHAAEGVHEPGRLPHRRRVLRGLEGRRRLRGGLQIFN